MDKTEKAMELFNKGCNCCQATFLPLCEEINIDPKIALKISSGFGGGMQQGEVCGAVSGAIMFLGLKNGNSSTEDLEAKEITGKLVKKFCTEFKNKNGSIICKELLGCNTSTEEGKQYAKDNNLRESLCENFVKDAIDLVDKY